jgi:hypothetical protein
MMTICQSVRASGAQSVSRGRGEIRIRLCFLTLLAVVSPSLGGCYTSSLSGPERIYTPDEELGYAKTYVAQFAPSEFTALSVDYRNSVIAARMYAIDLEYTQYESALLREGQEIDFATKVTSGVLTTVAGLTPAIATANALSGTATLVNGLDSAYNDKVLKSQMIQNVLASMRTARRDQAAVIYANMYCSVSVYPVGMAMSDLETYYRAGTFQTGLIKLMQTVGKAETVSKANQDTNKPAATTDAKATLDANAKEATVKAAPKAATGGTAGCKLSSSGVVVGAMPQHGAETAKRDSSTNVAGRNPNHLPM